MKEIFVNLKRFDIPKSAGGLCPVDDPIEWIEAVVRGTAAMGLGDLPGLSITYLLPEGLVSAARRALASLPGESGANLEIGVQGVHWDDVAPGKNFGAFTTAVPATAARNLGARWAIIGHSEERRFKSQVIQAYDPTAADEPAAAARLAEAVDSLVHAEVRQALSSGLNVLLCVGETAAERGEGSFEEQQPRIQAVLRRQLTAGLEGLPALLAGGRRVVVGYEPVWAIGPGKTPPGEEYIRFVSAYIQQTVEELFDHRILVVYGGGLKEENAAMIAGIPSIDGGLVALTRFTGEIGFDVAGLKGIVAKYVAEL